MKPTHRPHYRGRRGMTRETVDYLDGLILNAARLHGGLQKRFAEVYNKRPKKSARRAAARLSRLDQQIKDLACTKPAGAARARAVAEKIKRLDAERQAGTTWGRGLLDTYYDLAPRPEIWKNSR